MQVNPSPLNPVSDNLNPASVLFPDIPLEELNIPEEILNGFSHQLRRTSPKELEQLRLKQTTMENLHLTMEDIKAIEAVFTRDKPRGGLVHPLDGDSHNIACCCTVCCCSGARPPNKRD